MQVPEGVGHEEKKEAQRNYYISAGRDLRAELSLVAHRNEKNIVAGEKKKVKILRSRS